MNIFYILITAIIVLLSISAGSAKVMQIPQEMEFLQSFGLNQATIISFGVFQILAGVLLIPPRTRLYGALLAFVALVISTSLLLIDGNMSLGFISIITVILTSIIINQTLKVKMNR
ncbi:DoxX family protein [Shewanella sp. D64]|uniref:DoxX family protein n=1 Tax=unclassified Shewanella TaxID=196818 RepID=UPI0022BA644B|nr:MULTISPECIES: DoxX family protein [unclassified Shewanella]MEC4727106.1 DoxX family protein [Shewanella sp. D64]MEC4737845.1 DoxX family protein [Shewanella sp. E94]WBJ93899.1 DoxX family protein [Shewanella sp. MTB7]